MEKIECGMYVRTKYGIAKYVHKAVTKATIYYVVDKKIVYENAEGWEDSLLSNEILKASYNIIDLIEIGDIISYEFPTGLGMICYENVTVLPELLEVLQNGENNHEYIIKSIVTKEQLSQIEYRIGE